MAIIQRFQLTSLADPHLGNADWLLFGWRMNVDQVRSGTGGLRILGDAGEILRETDTGGVARQLALRGFREKG